MLPVKLKKKIIGHSLVYKLAARPIILMEMLPIFRVRATITVGRIIQN